MPAMVNAGEFVQMSGAWVNDRTHGQQFRAAFLKASPPTTLEGIERYLASGMIRGISPVYAKRLLRGFGEAVFDLFEQQPERLREVTGIGVKRAVRIIASWAEHPRDHASQALDQVHWPDLLARSRGCYVAFSGLRTPATGYS